MTCNKPTTGWLLAPKDIEFSLGYSYTIIRIQTARLQIPNSKISFLFPAKVVLDWHDVHLELKDPSSPWFSRRKRSQGTFIRETGFWTTV